MINSKLQSINKEMKKLFADFIERESNKESLVTVTRCEIAADRKNIDVFFSTYPVDQEKKVLAFLNRQKWNARDYMKKRIQTRVIPFVTFKIDEGEKNRQRIDELLKEV
ncbi:MAG: ribosome-binding factor A [Minisyncoccia bacterium]